MVLSLLFLVLPCTSVEARRGKYRWDANEPSPWAKYFQLTEEGVEHFMGKIAESNPEKAAELEKLRQEDPNSFEAELRKAVRKQMRSHFKDRKSRKDRGGEGGKSRGGSRGEQGKRGGKGYHGGPTESPRGVETDPEMARLHRRHGEHLEWLKENYPELAEGLTDLREKKPELYMKKLGRGFGNYWRIADAEKENPELAGILKDDLELKNRRDELVKSIKASADDTDKAGSLGELEDVLGERYDLILRQKQIRYEQLSKKLERFKDKVRKSESNVEKWKDAEFKKVNVKARIDELLGGKETFKWE